MKKIAALLLTTSLICTAAFSGGFFESRFFEYKVSVPVGVSNNAFALDDVMKTEAVIDLRKIAENLPNEGFSLLTVTKPTVELNFNILGVSVGTLAGVDVYGKVNLSNGLFDFVGKGLKVGETLDITVSPTFDVFAYGELNVGLKLKRFNMYVRPGVFAPILSTAGSSGGIKIVNSEDGSITIDYGAKVDVYSPFDLGSLFGLEGSSSSSEFDANEITSEVLNNLGFDMTMGMALPLSRRLVVSADARIPVYPATMKHKFAMVYEGQNTISVNSATEGMNLDFPEPEFQPSGTADYKINRPLRLMGYADYYPLGNLIDLRVGGGIGLYHPFMETAVFYPQYYAGATLNLINMLKISLSTEYTDQIFIHQLGTVVNIRLIEIDTGVSIQSSDFAKSWLVSGVGAYVVFCIGF